MRGLFLLDHTQGNQLCWATRPACSRNHFLHAAIECNTETHTYWQLRLCRHRTMNMLASIEPHTCAPRISSAISVNSLLSAMSAADFLALFSAFKSIPGSWISRCTTGVLPTVAAKCSGVCLPVAVFVIALTFAPAASSVLIHVASPASSRNAIEITADESITSESNATKNSHTSATTRDSA